jgi:hypothetical protein
MRNGLTRRELIGIAGALTTAELANALRIPALETAGESELRGENIAQSVAAPLPTEPNRSTTVKWINPVVPRVDRPAYAGQWSESTVPDTLDLQERAAHAVHCLTGTTDPEADYEIYWWVTFDSNPPYMKHHEGDVVWAKFMEALPLLRLVSGSGENPHVEQRWMEVLLQMQGPDGLLYFPRIGRPWAFDAWYGAAPPGDHYVSPCMNGRMLGAMTLYDSLTGDRRWKDAGRRVVDGLDQLSIHESGKAHFAWHNFGLGGQYVKGQDPSVQVSNPAAFHSWVIQGLTNYYRYSGYEPARRLARQIARFMMEDAHHFDATGRFLPEYPTGRPRIHFHSHTMVILSLLDYGSVVGDRDAIDFAYRGFRYALTQGETTLGYFPEWLDMETPQTLEICELADMTATAVKLSVSGTADCWDLVDQWTRNLLSECQLRRAEWVYWYADKSAPSVIPPYSSTDHPIERNLGAFGGFHTVNDYFSPRSPFERGFRDSGIQHCCTGNGSRALYYVWEKILTRQDRRLSINLLLNRVSPWADVESHIPYQGQVDIKIKQPADLRVRVPEWVKPEETTCHVNGLSREVRFDGRYAQVGEVKPADIATLTFPISETSNTIYVEKRAYRTLLRGNTCVEIDPPGVNCPLFQRDHMRESATRWIKRTQFMSNQLIDW